MIEINWFLLITQIATFLAAMAIVWKLFWGPLTLFMRGRAAHIAGELERAERGRLEIEALEAEHRRRLAELEERAQQEIKDALARGNQAKDQILEEARREAHAILEKAQADIRLERERVVGELRGQMTELSLAAVEKLIGQGLDQKVQERLLNQFVSELETIRSLS